MIIRRRTDWPTFDWKSPFEELERLRRQMDWLSSGYPSGILRGPTAGVFPLMNVTEDKDKYYVRAELPGIASDALDIAVTGDTLSDSGEGAGGKENENARYHRREREAGKFSRVVTLPSQIDTSKVEAHSVNGVLTITLPKAEAAKPRQITVKAS